MAADALASCVARTSAAMVFDCVGCTGPYLTKGNLTPPQPHCWGIIKTANIMLCFLRQILHQNIIDMSNRLCFFCILFQNWSSIGYILSKDKGMPCSSIIGNIMPADGLLIQRSQGCCAILGYPSETHLKLKSLEISFNDRLSWNFAQSTVVSLSCSVQNCKTFGQLKQMSWRN